MVVLYLALSKHVNLGHIPLLVFLVFWQPRQVSSRLYRVQRRLKGHLRPLSPSPPSLGFTLQPVVFNKLFLAPNALRLGQKTILFVSTNLG